MAAWEQNASPGTLEEVFRQAEAAVPLLTAKAAALALNGGGELWTQSIFSYQTAPMPPTGPEWSGISRMSWFGSEGLGAESYTSGGGGGGAWAQSSLKPWGRAVEKVVRCYGGDPARLLDCCRCVLSQCNCVRRDIRLLCK
jgi:hypothetical protein